MGVNYVLMKVGKLILQMTQNQREVAMNILSVMKAGRMGWLSTTIFIGRIDVGGMANMTL